MVTLSSFYAVQKSSVSSFLKLYNNVAWRGIRTPSVKTLWSVLSFEACWQNLSPATLTPPHHIKVTGNWRLRSPKLTRTMGIELLKHPQPPTITTMATGPRSRKQSSTIPPTSSSTSVELQTNHRQSFHNHREGPWLYVYLSWVNAWLA